MGGDCDDTDALVYPGAADSGCDAVDNDCDGAVDEDAPDGDGDGLADACDPCPGDVANDSDGDGVCDGIPPLAADVAPPMAEGVVTSVFGMTQFLYEGEGALQRGVAQGTIEAHRAGLIRGKIRTLGGEALPGVRITVLNHGEYGYTVTQPDGAFDLVVNGGQFYTLTVKAPGAPALQRTVEVGWQEAVVLDEIRVTPFDSVVTPITLGGDSEVQVAQGSPIEDGDGLRQSTVLFPSGLEAVMVMADGTRVNAPALSIRATEFTVGEGGPSAMPASLPPTSGYTFALELSADEAEAAGAVSVAFSKPVFFYVENFLGFPAGGIVPAGYYDRAKGAWLPAPNGQVIEVLGTAGDLALVDTDGDGAPESESALAALGILPEELEELALLYGEGASLWRVPMTHFTPWDCNWPYAPPPGAAPPSQPPPPDPQPEDEPCEADGSIVRVENQSLGEHLTIVGSDHQLTYQSERTRGYRTPYRATIPLSGDALPEPLLGISLKVTVAGTVMEASFAPQANLSTTIAWDGLDAYGREVNGVQSATIRLGYLYPLVYTEPEDFEAAFAQLGGAPIEGQRTSRSFTIYQEHQVELGQYITPTGQLGGWGLDVLHSFDPVHQTLYLGDGSKRSVQGVPNLLDTVAGDGSCCYGDAGTVATQASISPISIAVGPNGLVYIAQEYGGCIQRVEADGTLGTVVGSCGSGGYGAITEYRDGMDPTRARLAAPTQIFFDSQGSLTFLDDDRYVGRVGLDGTLERVLGTPDAGSEDRIAEPTPGVDIDYGNITAMGAAPDGTLYLVDDSESQLLQLTTDGLLRPFVDFYAFFPSVGLEASYYSVQSLAVAEDGRIFLAVEGLNKLVELGPDGSVSVVATLGDWSCPVEGRRGQPASEAGFGDIGAMAMGANSELMLSDTCSGVVWGIPRDGILRLIAGGGERYETTSGFPSDYNLYGVASLAYHPDGSIVMADRGAAVVRQFRPGFPSLGDTDVYPVVSEDGRQLFVFDPEGRHLRTQDTLTQVILRTFDFDDAGNLRAVIEGNGQALTLERGGDGGVTALVAPFGQRSPLTLDESGRLAGIKTPGGGALSLTHTADGLLTRYVDLRGGEHTFDYDDAGLLLEDVNPLGDALTLESLGEAHRQGREVQRNTPGGAQSICQSTVTTAGIRDRVLEGADGTRSTSSWTPEGSVTTLPDGVQVITTYRPDPRFGSAAAYVSEIQRISPSGEVMYHLERSREVGLSDPTDPLTLLSFQETTTENGLTRSLFVDGPGRSFTQTNEAGDLTTRIFDDQNRLVTVHRSDRASLSFVYDSHGRILSRTEGSDATARVTTYTYGDGPHPLTKTDPEGHTLSYSYDDDLRRTSTRLPTGHVQRRILNAAGDVLGETSPMGARSVYTYDAAGRLLEEVFDADGEAIRVRHSYDGAGNPVERIDDVDGLNLVTSWTWKAFGTAPRYRPLSVTLPDGTTSRTTYDAQGRRKSTLDPEGREEIYAYDDRGFLMSRETPEGRVYSFDYDDRGLLAAVEDPRGSVTELTFDSAGRLIQETLGAATIGGASAVSEALSRTYERGDLIAELIDGEGYATYIQRTEFGELESIIDDAGRGVAYVYDARGLPILTLFGAEDQVEMRTYDSIGRLVERVEDPEGLALATTYHYEVEGREGDGWNVAAVEDPEGNMTYYAWDILGRMTGLEDPTGATWRYGYDALGRRTSMVDPDGRATLYGYDKVGRLVEVREGSQVESWGYTASGDLATHVDFKGAVTAFAYDDDRRLVGINHPGSVPDVTLSWDGASNLASVVWGEDAITYAYDAANRRISRSHLGRTLGYGWDGRGNRTSIDYFGQGSVQYRYDGGGDVDQITLWNGERIDITRDARGRATTLVYPNGIRSDITADGAGRTTDVDHTLDGRLVASQALDISPDGRTIREGRLGVVSTFGFDDRGALIAEDVEDTAAGSAVFETDYTLDGAGNRTSRVFEGESPSTFTFDGRGILNGLGFASDANGSLTQTPTHGFTYDAARRLGGVTTPEVTTAYTYDGLGQLLGEAIIADGSSRERVLVTDDAGPMPRIVAEVEVGGPTTLYAWGPEGLMAQETLEGGAILYPLLDAQGSVIALTDGAAEVVETYAYDAYGAPRTEGGAPHFGFTGARHGADGTLYLRARHYWPELGRFLQRDTYPGQGSSPLDMNRYAFGMGAPRDTVDPTGHWPQWLEDAGNAARRSGRRALDLGRQTLDFIDPRNYDLRGTAANAAHQLAIDLKGYVDTVGLDAGQGRVGDALDDYFRHDGWERGNTTNPANLSRAQSQNIMNQAIPDPGAPGQFQRAFERARSRLACPGPVEVQVKINFQHPFYGGMEGWLDVTCHGSSCVGSIQPFDTWDWNPSNHRSRAGEALTTAGRLLFGDPPAVPVEGVAVPFSFDVGSFTGGFTGPGNDGGPAGIMAESVETVRSWF